LGLVRIHESKATREGRAYKILPKETKENACREAESIQHLSGHLSVFTLSAMYGDVDYLHLVMELCSRGYLIDDMAINGCYLESGCKTDQTFNIDYQIMA